MKHGPLALLAAIAFGASALPAQSPAQSAEQYGKQIEALPWVHGPATVPVGAQAMIRLPKGARYLDPQGTSKFLVLNGNPPTDSDYTIAPEANSWFAILEFDPAGYVSDKEKVDPAELFKQIKANEAAGNEERKSPGQTPLYLDRWLVEPHYDATSHNLEWGTVMREEAGGKLINYTSRILGREGVTKAILVSDPANFSADLFEYRTVLAGFSYKAGKDYQSHQAGDKVAAYGLGALVAGGAAAVAAKSGLFAILLKFGIAFYKLIFVGVVGLVAAFRGRIGRLFGRRAGNDNGV